MVLDRIWPRLDSEPPLFFDDELAPSVRDPLVSAGWLRPSTPSNFLVCRECGNGRVVRVLWVDVRPGKPPLGILPCPDCGPSQVSGDRLRRWMLAIPALPAAVLTAAGGKAAPVELLPERLWKLGTASWAGQSRAVLFARQIHSATRHEAVAVLARHSRAVLWVPTEDAGVGWAGQVANPVMALASVAVFTENGLSVDGEMMARQLVDSWTGERAQPRVRRKRAERAANIEQLTNEMIAHVRAARDHAVQTRDATGAPALLPRPTQKQLARRTGLSETAVSRCLGDQSARELRIYWDLALDLSAILGWRNR